MGHPEPGGCGPLLTPRPAPLRGPPPRTHPELPLLHFILLAPPCLLQEGDLGSVLGELCGLGKERKPRLFPERFQQATREGRVTYFGRWCPIPGRWGPSPTEAAPRRGCRVHSPPLEDNHGGAPSPPATLYPQITLQPRHRNVQTIIKQVSLCQSPGAASL